MGQIKILDDRLADKIAAGEVVERPLSVVKELLENSLDAGADFIDIEIRDGGVGLIRVKDNGRGMDAEDLRMAFERHATSKIQAFQDLYSLHTFGFRGEALPSIAAVAQVEMTTGTDGEETGHKIRIDGGVVSPVESCPPAGGTVMEVKNLFFNVPARRKFLKSASYEAGLIGDLVSKYAIGHPSIRFRYVANGRLQMDTAGLDTVPKRIAYLYGNNLEPLIVALPKSDLGNERYLTAWLVREEITRNNRGQEIFFVNGRLVKSGELSSALEEGYYTLIPKGRFPVAVMQLEFPGEELDVNVHPAKTEIKINRFDQIRPRIVDYLKDILWQANITKNAYLPESVAPGAYYKNTEPVSEKRYVDRVLDGKKAQVDAADKTKNPVSAPHTTNQQTDGTNIDQLQEETEAAGIASVLPDSKVTPEKREKAFTPHSEAVPVEKTISTSSGNDIVAEPEKLYQMKSESRPKPVSEKSPAQQQDFFASEPLDSVGEKPKQPISDNRSEGSVITKRKPSVPDSVELKNIGKLKLIGQLNNAFILAQNEEGLYIIDQHTCHERILYEKFMREESEKQIVSQPLLIPAAVNLSAQQESILMQHIFTLRELGLEVENFGDRSYLIRSLPLGLHDMTDVEGFFMDLLHDLEEQKEVTAADIKEKLLITASCKGAVKANWSLTDVEMMTLLHDLSQVENAHTCPHGRPIVYKITMNELYKIFKRGTYHD